MSFLTLIHATRPLLWSLSDYTNNSMSPQLAALPCCFPRFIASPSLCPAWVGAVLEAVPIRQCLGQCTWFESW
ncbi:hypothetical protein IF2G_09438 [Cordyceps javanica]|nr:hypothetical protein IF2G_09438 [Cordyceps javanica]